MQLKKCFKCGKEKDRSEFYKHPQMGDGLLGKCKECTKSDSLKRYVAKAADDEWFLKERDRSREKYHRLGYGEIGKEWLKKYPEKYKARCATSVMKSTSEVMHHWSYCKEHRKDVFDITVQQHHTIHRFMKYDQERMMYRDLDGVLIDSREKAEAYYQKCYLKSHR
jgi:hypothetical protein